MTSFKIDTSELLLKQWEAIPEYIKRDAAIKVLEEIMIREVKYFKGLYRGNNDRYWHLYQRPTYWVLGRVNNKSGSKFDIVHTGTEKYIRKKLKDYKLTK